MTERTKTLQLRVGVGAVSSPLEVGAERAPTLARELAKTLINIGCEVVELGTINSPDTATSAGRKLAESHVDAVAISAVCWFEDYLILDLLEECNIPILLWAIPGMETGALCGTQQLTAYLKQLDVPFTCVFGEIGDSESLSRASSFLRGAALKSKLRRSLIGIAGHHVNGMTHTAPNEITLKKVVGPRVVRMDLPALLERAKAMSEKDAMELWAKLRGKAGSCEVDDAEGIDSMRVYAALREAVDKDGLDAITVGCYPHLMGRVCLAASLLADDGIPMACEGDVHGAVGQYILQLLTGQPTHNTDWLDPVDDESVIFTHCGSGSFSLAEDKQNITLGSVRLMGQGVCALFTARPGPVTLVSINTHQRGYQCALLEGEAIPTEMVFPGNPVCVRFGKPVKQLIDWIHEMGIGHHWMIGYGHVAAEVRDWAKIAGSELHIMEL